MKFEQKRNEMNYHYKIIETAAGSRYVLHDGDDPIGAPLTEVAVCFDKENGILHKHGNHEMVSHWYQNSRKKLIEGGAGFMADDLMVICGPIELEELNRMLTTSGYCKRYMEKLNTGDHEVVGDQDLPKP